MNQIKGLLRETWWLWLLMFSASLLMGILVTPIYLIVLPGLIVTMVYFALIRYDRDGNNIDRVRQEKQRAAASDQVKPNSK